MSKADQAPTTLPTSIIDMLRFATELAYALQYKAKSDNWHANDHYSTTFYSTASQDAAYEECSRTAALADACADLVVEMEDALWPATNRSSQASEKGGIVEQEKVGSRARLVSG